MKNILYILLLVPMLVFSQNEDLNYVKTQVYTADGSSPANTRENVTYYDGLGRPVQQVIGKASANGKDVITHIEYDAYNRQPKQYLPYEASTSNLTNDVQPKLHTEQFYLTPKYENTLNPYSEQIFEASPLNRVFKQAAPGDLWKSAGLNNNTDHTIKFDYQTNIADEVRRFVVSFPNDTEHPLLVCTGYYDADQLYKSIIKDENWTAADGKSKTTEEFKDKEGRMLLKRNYTRIPDEDNPLVMVDVPHDTYYVYDDYSNLTYVIPPLASDTIVVEYRVPEVVYQINVAAENLCYIYHYDRRNRVIRKHIPDNGWTYIVYDKLDRPVSTQDENLRAKPYPEHNWLFTSYDALGRVVITGSYYASYTEEFLRQGIDDLNPVVVEAKTGTPIINDGMKVYYDDATGFSHGKVFTVNYYDDYNFDTGLGYAGQTMPNANYYVYFDSRTKGLPTGSLVKVLGTDKFITSLTQYDKKARPTWTWSYNTYFNTSHGVESNFDFMGKVLETRTQHKQGDNENILIYDFFAYDNADRPLHHFQKIGEAGIKKLIAWNKYDALGVVEQKKVGGTYVFAPYASFNAWQTIDYTQNIRGWLTGINKADGGFAGSASLFSFEIDYSGLYNGNISGTTWTSKQDNQAENYQYSYDGLNRLTDAVYTNYRTVTEKHHEKDIKYDKNGNILSLQRWGYRPLQGVFDQIDNLTYSYGFMSNQLTNVVDASVSSGFKDGTNTDDDYDYDNAGNLKYDRNKGIDIGQNYNYLNLPTAVIKDNDHKVEYVYDATGAKIEKKVTDGVGNITTTHYSYGFIYEDNALQYFSHPEGYVKRETNGNFSYVYQYKDHLGNVRLSYSDLDGDGTINDVPGFYEGFENEGGWNINYLATVSRDSSKKHNGNYSGKIINNNPGGEVYCISDYTMPINNSVATSYTFSGWYYSEGPSIDFFLYMYTEPTNVTFDYIGSSTATGAWQYIERQVIVPANIKYFRFRVDNNANGTVWFDDLSIKKTDAGTSEIVDNNDYYPYGMKHEGSNVMLPGNAAAQRIKFNGMELQDELGINWYDYQARNYDPAIGRWFNIDPLAEKSRRFSPYTYALDNPVFFVDPDGMEATGNGSVGYLSALGADINGIETSLFDLPTKRKPDEKEKNYNFSSYLDGLAISITNNNESGIDPPKPGEGTRSGAMEIPGSDGLPSGKLSPSTILKEVVINYIRPRENTGLDGYFYTENKGPNPFSPYIADATGFTLNANVNTGIFGSFYINGGIAFNRYHNFVFFGGAGGNFGYNGGIGSPGFGFAATFDMHDNYGGNTDVLQGLGGINKSYFGGLGIMGSYSKSAISNPSGGYIFDKKGVETKSIGLGFGFGGGTGVSKAGVTSTRKF